MELNPQLISETTVSRIHDGYQESSGDLNDDHFQIITSPFKVLRMKDVCLEGDFVRKLMEEVKALDYHRKNNDLYSLWQSEDLTHHEDGCISQFVQTLRQSVGKLLSKVMNVEFNENFTLTASLYKSGDVLLCHDDKCADRCVAFVYYLTGTGKEEGGAFEMFDRDESTLKNMYHVMSNQNEEKSSSKLSFTYLVEESVVTSKSSTGLASDDGLFHKVSEVRDRTFERISLNGWFHSNRELSPLEYVDPMPPLLNQVVRPGETFLDEFFSVLYAVPSTMKEAQKNFEIESQILFADFIQSELYDNCVKELKNTLQWKIRGPANRRKYSVVENVEEPNLKKLISFLGSPPFFSYLSDLTGLSLTPKTDDSGSEELPAQYSLEVQKWDPGAYTMATDNDEFFKKSGLDLYLWFNTAEAALTPEDGGTVTYLAADEDEDEDDEDTELLSIDPVDNAMVLVYRTEDTVKFTKYINHSTTASYFCIAATYYESEET